MIYLKLFDWQFLLFLVLPVYHLQLEIDSHIINSSRDAVFKEKD